MNSIARTNAATALKEARRLLTPFWIPREDGGICLLTYTEEKAAEVQDVMARLLPDAQAEFTDDPGERAIEYLAQLCGAFLVIGCLEPGVYELDNVQPADCEGGGITMDEEDTRKIDRPDTPTVRFELTAEHLTLLRHLAPCRAGISVALLDWEQPYPGDSSDFRANMAAILGDPAPEMMAGQPVFSQEQEARYDKLHGEMLFAAHAFWTYATL